MDELTPIYRIEFFLDAIVNNSANPLSPIYRVEYYLAKIAGEDVEIPTPVYRMEKYLAKLCGEDVELPTPEFRIEFYLAKLCGMEVEVPDPIYRVEYWLWNWCGGGGIEKTVTGNPIHITDALAKPVQALSIALEPIQSGSGDPSPDNVCPISGHTDADVIVSPTLNPLDGTTYPIPLGTTVYGGTLDVVTGKMTVTHALYVVDSADKISFIAENTNRAYITQATLGSKKTGGNYFDGTLCSKLRGAFSGNYRYFVGSGGTVALYLGADTYATKSDWFDAIGEFSILYPLDTPIEISLTPEEITLLEGENNLWSEGDMTLVYLADGNGDTSNKVGTGKVGYMKI